MNIIYKTNLITISHSGENIEIQIQDQIILIDACAAEKLASALMRRLHESQVLLRLILSRETEAEWARTVPVELTPGTYTGTLRNDIIFEKAQAEIDRCKLKYTRRPKR